MNLKINKIDPFSTFKFGILLSSAISLITLVLLFFYNLIRSVILAFSPQHIFVKAFINGMIQLFFYLILLALFTIFFGIVSSFVAFIYNYTSEWFDGIKLEISEIKPVPEENIQDSENAK